VQSNAFSSRTQPVVAAFLSDLERDRPLEIGIALCRDAQHFIRSDVGHFELVTDKSKSVLAGREFRAFNLQLDFWSFVRIAPEFRICTEALWPR
jgi:hypothetical protein